MRLAARWICRLTERAPTFSIQYHADQDLSELCTFWGETLGIDPSTIKLLRKSNSNQMTGRVWRSRHGVLTVRVRTRSFARAYRPGWTSYARSGGRL
ncbi:MAG TPA: hypothetical protein VMU32_00185 [Solirubrobacteraceae bacterium]|nr:hypothetical protein [Solirubrobacteraceae bacterium]